ncbi:hypothetical protein, partial [Bosea sp. ASV33]|uniref:hypothetical protein n=1 Tax=Bosea sp. ASV33 TaxID=2795106 RepID=UPI001AED824E
RFLPLQQPVPGAGGGCVSVDIQQYQYLAWINHLGMPLAGMGPWRLRWGASRSLRDMIGS